MQKVVSLSKNLKGNDYVVGDIHGEFKMLDKQLEELGFDKTKDRLISVGDLIDRGPDSDLSVKYLLEDWFYAVRGNHETFCIDYKHSEDQMLLDCWMRNGGDWILGKDYDMYYNAFVKLPLMIEVEVEDKKIGIAHADLPPNSPWDLIKDILEEKNKPSGVEDDSFEEESSEQSSYDASFLPMVTEYILWERESINRFKECEHWGYPFEYDKYHVDGIDWVFFGHTPTKGTPLKICNRVYIDTGTFFNKEPLCIVNLNDWVKEKDDNAKSE